MLDETYFYEKYNVRSEARESVPFNAYYKRWRLFLANFWLTQTC
jgi:hypothetical protein